MIPKGKNLNPQAVARAQNAQVQRLAASQPDQKCLGCGSITFVSTLKLKVIPPILLGTAVPVIVPGGAGFACAACGRPWKIGESNEPTGTGEEGGTDTPPNDGGSIISG